MIIPLTHDEKIEQVRHARQQRYALQTDVMAFRALRGEITVDEYKAAVDAIRAELPYPDEDGDEPA